MTRRVVITGIGAVTPCGVGADALWQAAMEGRTGITARLETDLPTIPLEAAGFIRDFEPSKVIANRKSLKVMCRDIQMAVVASYLARENASLTSENIVPTRSGVCIGAGVFEHDPDEMADSFRESVREDGTFDVVKFGATGMGSLFPLWLLKYLPNMPACHITIAHNLQGPSNTITADSSGSISSLEESVRVIERGTADLMFCGGAECGLYGAGLLRYNARGDLKTAAGAENVGDYPIFSERSGGIVPGEGGTILVLESADHARARGGRVLAEVLGFFSGGDYSEAGTARSAPLMAHAMREAIRKSGLKPEEIDVVHVSARGLEREDRAEAEAIREVFGAQAHKPRLAATKALTGFLGYSAAPVEIALAARSLSAGRTVPSIMKGGPLLKDFVMTSAADNGPVKRILVNHFESGLANHSVVLGRAEDPARA